MKKTVLCTILLSAVLLLAIFIFLNRTEQAQETKKESSAKVETTPTKALEVADGLQMSGALNVYYKGMPAEFQVDVKQASRIAFEVYYRFSSNQDTGRHAVKMYVLENGEPSSFICDGKELSCYMFEVEDNVENKFELKIDMSEETSSICILIDAEPDYLPKTAYEGVDGIIAYPINNLSGPQVSYEEDKEHVVFLEQEVEAASAVGIDKLTEDSTQISDQNPQDILVKDSTPYYLKFRPQVSGIYDIYLLYDGEFVKWYNGNYTCRFSDEGVQKALQYQLDIADIEKDGKVHMIQVVPIPVAGCEGATYAVESLRRRIQYQE